MNDFPVRFPPTHNFLARISCLKIRADQRAFNRFLNARDQAARGDDEIGERIGNDCIRMAQSFYLKRSHFVA